MQNLIRFIWKHHFTFLFLLLELVAFTLVVQTNSFHNSRFISITNGIAGNVYQAVNNFTEYVSLSKVNKELAEENAALHNRAKSSLLPIQENIYRINDTLYQQQYTYMPAKAINSTENRSNNYIILNKGRNQGVKEEMGIICPNGIVGIVRDVSSNFSSVFSMLHSNTKISAKLAKSNYHGIVEWDGQSSEYVLLRNIPGHVAIKKGDEVVTRGGGAIFPEGIMIGKIADFNTSPGNNFYEITVKLSTNFRNLTHVYIIKNLLKEEQKQLEQAFKQEEANE